MGALAGCRFQVSGPTGAFVVILLGVVNKFGIEGLFVAGFLAGVILLLAGLFRFGTVIKFIPYPVIVGFTAGIGVTIFYGQIKDALGLSYDHRPDGFVETIQAIYNALSSHGLNLSSIIILSATLVALILWKKKIKSIPPAPFALLVGIIVSLLISALGKDFLPAPIMVGSIPSGLPQFHWLNLNWDKIQSLLPSAFTIAMLGAIESLLSAVVADGMTGTKHNSNKELISQGIGNIILPFFGGIPATGAIARTATNIRNGAHTRISSIVHGLVLLLIVLLAAPLAAYIPMAALAAILINISYNMVEIPHFAGLLRAPRPDALVLIITFLLTVFVDLTMAVAVGIVLAALLFIQRVSQLNISRILDESLSHGSEGSKRLHASVEKYPQIRLYELTGPLFFGAASCLEDQIEHDHGQTLILRMKHVGSIDATAIHALETVINKVIHQKNGKVYLATLQPEIYKILEHAGLIKKIGGAHYAPESATMAIELAKAELKLT
jgi:SulP family sulfate permease